MKHKHLGLLILAGLLMMGCQAAPAPAEKPAISVAYPSEPDLGDVPSLMALDLLRSQGYEVTETSFAEPPLAVEAVSRGDAQFSFGAMQTHWSAIQKGGKIVTIMEQLKDTWVLVASNEITQCSDIDGKKLAVSSPGAGSAALTRAYIAKNCPDAEPELVLISGSSNRAAALLAGEVDVTPIELPDLQELQQEAPDKIRVLVTFADDLPDVMVTGVHANKAFASANPEVVKDFLNALLTVNKQNEADPAGLVKKAAEVLKMDVAEVEPLIKTHLDFHAWPIDGGLTEARVTSSLDYYVFTGDLEKGITARDVANWDYLQAALGKQVISPAVKWRNRLISLVVFALLWEAAGHVIESLLLPTFSETMVALLQLIGTEALWRALWISNQALLIGYAAALVIGLPLGIWMGSSPVFGRIAGVYLTIMLMTPTAALIPLILIAVGLNLGARAIVVFLFSVPFVVLNTRAGMNEVDRSLVEMARSFCATRWQILWRAVIPTTLPAMMLGARVGLGRAFTGMVTVELLLIAVGLGRLIIEFQGRYEAGSLYAVILVVLVEAALLMKVTRWLENRIMPWTSHS